MRILNSYNEIISIGKECLSNHSSNKHGSWEQSMEAFENTIQYIFNYLHHSCYLLCITNGVPTIYKIVNKKTISKVAKTLKHRKFKIKHKTWRVIQCIVKEHSYHESTPVEWERFFKEFPYKLPDGAFILNLTDAVLLRKDRTNPWPMVPNDIGKYKFSKFIPILGGSGKIGYEDISIPNYDDIRIVLGYDKIPEFETNWDNKKDIAVFRGTPTGCGTTEKTNMRLKISTLKNQSLNAVIVKYSSIKFKFDPIIGLSTIDSSKFKTVSFMDMVEQSKHKYIIHIDGNVAAYRLLKTMLTNSVILKVEGEYTLWVDELLQPMKHYIPIKSDLSNLLEMIEWCKQNDSKVRKIAERGYEFAKKALTKEYICTSILNTLNSVV